MIAFLIVFFVASAHANDLREILSTRSVAELDRHESAATQVEHARSNCEAELAAHLLPRSCFKQLKLKGAARSFRSGSGESARLSRICEANARQSRSRLDLSRPLAGLPSECQRIARERLEDLRYIDEAEKPELSALRTLGPDIEDDSGETD